jgi:hypothetical protein
MPLPIPPPPSSSRPRYTFKLTKSLKERALDLIEQEAREEVGSPLSPRRALFQQVEPSPPTQAPIERDAGTNPVTESRDTTLSRAAAATGRRKGRSRKRPARRPRPLHPELPKRLVNWEVELSGGRQAIVRFEGPTNFAVGDWVGIELSKPTGRHAGVVDGHRYFRCQKNAGVNQELNYGAFVRRGAIKRAIRKEEEPRRRSAREYDEKRRAREKKPEARSSSARGRPVRWTERRSMPLFLGPEAPNDNDEEHKEIQDEAAQDEAEAQEEAAAKNEASATEEQNEGDLHEKRGRNGTRAVPLSVIEAEAEARARASPPTAFGGHGRPRAGIRRAVGSGDDGFDAEGRIDALAAAFEAQMRSRHAGELLAAKRGIASLRRRLPSTPAALATAFAELRLAVAGEAVRAARASLDAATRAEFQFSMKAGEHALDELLAGLCDDSAAGAALDASLGLDPGRRGRRAAGSDASGTHRRGDSDRALQRGGVRQEFLLTLEELESLLGPGPT